MSSSDRALYPELEAYRTRRLRVSDVHELYVEESGNPDGIPVAVLHGGPGSGTSPIFRRYFDPNAYRIIGFDQRGAKRSTPFLCTQENTIFHLVSDMEKIRKQMGIDRWQIFGTSWGTTLALTYAIEHPQRVRELVLSGVFLGREREVSWLYQKGASGIFPDLWPEFLAPIPKERHGDLLRAYYEILTGPDLVARQRAARAWVRWEGRLGALLPDPEDEKRLDDPELQLSCAVIGSHMLLHGSHIESTDYLLERINKIRAIPGVIVHGRYDMVCPASGAWDLHRAWPEAAFTIVPDAGHSLTEAGMADVLVEATNAFRES